MQSRAKDITAYLEEVPIDRREALHRLIYASRAHRRPEGSQRQVGGERHERWEGRDPLLQTRAGGDLPNPIFPEPDFDIHRFRWIRTDKKLDAAGHTKEFPEIL